MDASITASHLKSELAGAQPPLLIDVRRSPAFRAAPEMAAGALRRDPAVVPSWAKELPRAASVVVYCVHGHEVSQGAAQALRELGFAARYLEGGLEKGWRAAGGALLAKPKEASTRWITRERPKIDRIACPWLISRFIDPGPRRKRKRFPMTSRTCISRTTARCAASMLSSRPTGSRMTPQWPGSR
jgi:rhodanese-related sulfurtransferase